MPLLGTHIPGADTMPKLASAINVPAYACSSRSGQGMARASLDNEDAWEDDFQTLHTPVCRVVWWDGDSHGEPATERMEASRGSPSWQPYYQVDVGEEEAEMLVHQSSLEGHPLAPSGGPGHHRGRSALVQVSHPADVGGVRHSFVIGQAPPCGVEYQGSWEDACPPAPTILNIGQFMTEEEVAEGMGEPHWFMAYSCALQWVGEAACGWKWEWPTREALEVKVSPVVLTFWQETGVDLTVTCIKLCWEPTPRALYHKRENGPTAHVSTFLDKLAVLVPSLDAWDQLVWRPTAAIPWVLTEAELYGYCHGQAVDLGPVMLAAQFWLMDEGGIYLCIARALMFEGSVLAYNPAKNEAEWVPVHGLANDLTWAEERSAVALANYVLCIPEEVARIAILGACRIVSWPDDSSTLEEEEAQHPKLQTMDTEPEWGEESEDRARQIDLEEGVEPNRQQHSQDSEAVMEGSEGLAYDDPRSDSNAMVTGADCPWGPVLSPHTPSHVTLHMLGSPMD